MVNAGGRFARVCCLGEIISNLRVDILDGRASLLAQIGVNRFTAIVFRGPYARFKQCSLREDRIEIYVRVAWLVLYLGWEDCLRGQKREVKDGLQMEIHILFSDFSQESHDSCKRMAQYACDRASFAGSRPVLIPLTTILARIEETGV
jgi:hypothetical protein